MSSLILENKLFDMIMALSLPASRQRAHRQQQAERTKGYALRMEE